MRAPKPTDVRIREVAFSYEEYDYRTPLKFGGLIADKATLLNVHVRVETRSGRAAGGFGSMTLGNVWSFPSRVLSYDAHIPEVAAIESHARQYLPAANRAWKSRFPSIFTVRNGELGTGVLDGLGLGAVPEMEEPGL